MGFVAPKHVALTIGALVSNWRPVILATGETAYEARVGRMLHRRYPDGRTVIIDMGEAWEPGFKDIRPNPKCQYCGSSTYKRSRCESCGAPE